MEVKVKDRQSLLDIALQTAGSLDALFDLAVTNNVGITDAIPAGMPLETATVIIPEVVYRYRVEGVKPATALDAEDRSLLLREGINYMGIEIDFVVS